MPEGLEATSRLLAITRNRAVLPILLAGLRSTSEEARAAAIRATIRRHDADSHRQLIRHFSNLGESEHEVLRDAHRTMPHHAAPALKAAVLEGDATFCENACRIIAFCCDCDLFPTLVKAAENPKHRHLAVVLATIFDLANQVYSELNSHSAGQHRTGHDPAFARHHLLVALERSLAQYGKHQRHEILDAFLLLAPADNATFLRILRDARNPCHAPLAAALATSQVSGIMDRLVNLLRDTDAPTAVLEAIAQRTDREFLEVLLRNVKYPVPVRVLHNMKRLRAIAWLETHHNRLLELDGRAQAVAIELATASDMKRSSLFELLSIVLSDGMAEGRRASCTALARFNGPQAEKLVLAALDDPDAGVQAAALRQLRARRVPDALAKLVARLDSPSVEVRDAARSSLAEFNFIRYRAMFDLLDEHAVRTTGVLVHKVDTSSRDKLLEELSSPSLTCRLRGIEMAVAMEATDDVREKLMELARHEDATIRQEAVAALAHCHGSDIVAALEIATRDSSPIVAATADQSLRDLRRAKNQPSHESATIAGGAK